jgi:23S rRNA (pseudouridine1915-N3)-methyltransferase
MKIVVLNIGRTSEPYLREGLALYEKRIRHYIPFDMVYLPEPKQVKSQQEKKQKENEGRILLSALDQIDHPVLLDEHGRQMNSIDFSNYLQQAMNKGTRTLGFIIGGPYGFSEAVYRTVPDRISLSGLTFPHQLIRLLFLEQLYRGLTIIRGEPYHHA